MEGLYWEDIQDMEMIGRLSLCFLCDAVFRLLMNSPLFRKKNSKNDKNITALVGNFSPPSSVDHQREIVGGSRSPSVSSPTHTPLSSPNFKSKDRNINKSLITEVALNQPINHILPKTVCKLLNSAIIIINLWGSSEKE